MATKVITGICTTGGAFLGGVGGYFTWGGMAAQNALCIGRAISEEGHISL